MRIAQSAVLGMAALCLSTAPAFASGGDASVPEPNVVTLLTLACAGVVIGRRMACKSPPQE